MTTKEQFSKLFPLCVYSEEFVNLFKELLPIYGIDTPRRQAAFISQCGYESGGWRVFEENLNYSSNALDLVFPKYFKNAGVDSREYHKNPEKIANYVYANRMGNGDVESGDGWKYRGRGPIQLTGKDNYLRLSNYLNLPVYENPDSMLEDTSILIESSIWFWNNSKLNKHSDSKDIYGITRKVNGGLNGYESRVKLFQEVLDVIDMNDNDVFDIYEDYESWGVLKFGSKGEGVEFIQKVLGLRVDGDFGKNTERKVIEYQKSKGLFPDGVVGPKTIELMLY